MLDFPASPTTNQKYPASPVAGVPTYTWDGEKWTTKSDAIAAVTAATAAEYLANSQPAKMVTSGTAWGAAATLSSMDGGVATITPNMSLGIDFYTTLSLTNHTLANPTNVKVGQKGMIYLSQGFNGGKLITTWGSAYKFPGGTKPTLTATFGATDAISYAVVHATNIICSFMADMK